MTKPCPDCAVTLERAAHVLSKLMHESADQLPARTNWKLMRLQLLDLARQLRASAE